MGGLDFVEPLFGAHIAEIEKRYAEVCARTGFDGIVVHSGTPKKRTAFDDQFFPLRPTPELHLWAPLFEPDCFVVFVAGSGGKTTLVWPECTSFWERPAPPESLAFMNVLEVRRIPTPELPKGKRLAWVGEDLAKAKELGFSDEAINPRAVLEGLDRGRVTKTPYEIACLAEANRLASLGHDAVKHAFIDGQRNELELHLLYLKATKQDDQDTPYKNIVALGRNGAVLHHVSYGRTSTTDESLLVDAGACFLGYCSDVTRTWTRGASAFASLIHAMEEMQKRLVAKIAIGMPYEELHDESHRQVSAILVEAGIAAKGTRAEEIDEKGVSRAFYPHGLGHSLGLVTHDVGCAATKPRPDNPFLRNTSTVAAGQVFTIEPGLYFIDGMLGALRDKPEGKLVDWRAVASLAPYGGIRIEDDILVRDADVRNFTREVLPIGGGAV
ncbi:MAG: Xaa-Pro dipeptidase [Deltaproteobacteria bacterium]|nr:Xaa-Pro dipeptidase [Deltaproteobacteria bacterium]